MVDVSEAQQGRDTFAIKTQGAFGVAFLST